MNRPNRSRTVWVRYIVEEDIPQLIKWAARIADLNLADPEILNYDRLTIYCAHRDGKPICYMPAQLTVTLESLAPNPDATPDELTLALFQLIAAVQLDAQREGIREIYFVCRDDRVSNAAIRRGFTEIPWKVLCLDIGDFQRSAAEPVAEPVAEVADNGPDVVT